VCASARACVCVCVCVCNKPHTDIHTCICACVCNVCEPIEGQQVDGQTVAVQSQCKMKCTSKNKSLSGWDAAVGVHVPRVQGQGRSLMAAEPLSLFNSYNHAQKWQTCF
jgi:hypothetical protein